MAELCMRFVPRLKDSGYYHITSNVDCRNRFNSIKVMLHIVKYRTFPTICPHRIFFLHTPRAGGGRLGQYPPSPVSVTRLGISRGVL